MSASNRPGAHHYRHGSADDGSSLNRAVRAERELRAENAELRARLAAVEVRIAHALRELREHRVAHAVAFLTGEHDDALRGEGEPWPDCPDHREVQHRDGKPPWCKACGWNRGRPATPPQQVRP